MFNSFGHLWKITTFGESHGPGMGVVLDGIPAGIEIDVAQIQAELNLRKPGTSLLTSSRNENDEVEVLSGVYNGMSTGAPLAMWVKNKDQRPEDYSALKEVFRPSHADYTYSVKYEGEDLLHERRLPVLLRVQLQRNFYLNHLEYKLLHGCNRLWKLKCLP